MLQSSDAPIASAESSVWIWCYLVIFAFFARAFFTLSGPNSFERTNFFFPPGTEISAGLYLHFIHPISHLINLF